MRQPPADFEGEEVMICMVLAFCIAGASVEFIYKLLS